MDARKILVKRLAVSLVVGMLLAVCLCVALDEGKPTSVVGSPALALGDFPMLISIIRYVQVVPIRDVDLGFHVTWEADILVGDYNHDGRVSIADITPIAMHFGEEVDGGWYLTMLDDNDNGVIDVGDIDGIRRYYGIWVPWFRLELRNYETGVWRLVRVVYWSWHLVPVTERCAFEADVQAKPGEQRLRIQPFIMPISAPFCGTTFSLLPYLQPSSQ